MGIPTPLARRRVAALAAAALAGCAGARTPRSAAPGSEPGGEGRRAFAVPGHGSIEIAVPRGWTAEASADDPSAPSTIRLEQPGASFVALLTPFWDPGEADDEAAPGDAARLFAELARRNALGGSVEREIPLQELGGEGVHGFWFGATDRELVGKEPGPEEWRHVIQGAAAVGELVVAFTLLDNAPGPQREALLEVVRGARHLPDAEERRAAGGMEPDPDARTVPLEVEAQGRSWSVLVDLPGFRVFRPRRGDEGIGVLVFGQHPESGIVVSVILRSAGDARDAAGCREADLSRIREAVPEMGELRLGAAGDAVRAAYAVVAPEADPVRQEHGHAWLHREDVCASVHVSKMAPAPSDAELLERILASVRFGERL
jgi:hypothetical protein